MKKIIFLLFAYIGFSFGAPPSQGDLPDFTPMFAIRSLETGISLSPFRDSSTKLEDQNWILREIVLSEELKQKDTLADKLPFGYVQFVNPSDDDLCLAILESGFFGGKSCKQDLEDGKLETVYSIMPTTTSAVQIRSLVLGGVECMVVFNNPQVPIEQRFGIQQCTLDDPALFLELYELMFFTPAIVEATPLY
ncbi:MULTISPECIES: cytolethal distending toxin subunit A [Campylobacter]|uniref:Cytolethal distending toxin C n=1 Tax=Campylobacter lari TaxID=201 RepID=E5RM36_CAMLA|nr:cytolethal distending toxin subunit A [Campylobacter lari]MCR8676680.1 cytolethal distending toxin subunit A [Campylobacter sp. S4:11]EAJ6150498.1 cytolethal distending toxin subunit A [Campylobacter lari]EAJ6151717.1 cytolethal distending toxin subunit A [Campylobacter lari]EHZ4885185.1 cytolethal distending toxin subunit A [Campylobacter lari]EHZ4886227.1 cytolethal distending toxin subunit A [Campylobacter lari]